MKFRLAMLLIVSHTFFLSSVLAGPKEDIELLRNQRHGISKLSPESRVILKRLKENPDIYLPHFKTFYSKRMTRALQSEMAEKRFGRTCTLIRELNSPKASALLSQWYFDLGEVVDRIRAEPRKQQAERLQGHVLLSLADQAVPEIHDYIIENVLKMRPSQRIFGLQYLSRTGRGNSELKRTIRLLYEDPKSLVFRAPTLREWMEQRDSNTR